MKSLHRIALVLAVAEVAVLAAAVGRHASHPRTGRHGPDGCGARDIGPSHRAGHHGPPRRADAGHAPWRAGPAGGPPPWVRERLAEWHRDQHADDLLDGRDDQAADGASDAPE